MKAARIIDLTFDGRLSTGRSNISNVCSEGSLRETRVEELNALQLDKFALCHREEAVKYSELQFSRGYSLDDNKQMLIIMQRQLTIYRLATFLERESPAGGIDNAYHGFTKGALTL